MTTIGLLIKKHRIKNALSQAVLADGICSISYLSKVESRRLFPHEDISKLLLLRLDLQVKKLSSEKENEYIKSLEKLYKKAVLYKGKKLNTSVLKEFSPCKIDFSSYNNYLFAQLYFFRILITLKKKANDVSFCITELNYLADDLNSKQRYLYNLNLGLYHYYNNNIFSAIACMESSYTDSLSLTLEEWENADLFHILSIFFSKNDNNSKAFYYSSKASSYFISNNLIEKSIDSYIIMGNSKQNLLDYNSAITYFSLAQKLSKIYNLNQYTEMIYHNLGSLLSKQGKHEQAIEHFLLSINLKEKKEEYEKSLPTILSLIQELMKEKKYDEASEWSKKGLDLLSMLQKVEENSALESYRFHFEVFLNFLEEDKLFRGSLRRAIKYFKAKNDYRYAYKYSIYLGEYLYSTHKYKAASEALMEANKIILLEKSTRLEEL